jgi:hypothetical protein
MDITGHSTDYVTDVAFYTALTRFAERQSRRWPGLYVNGRPVDPASPPPLGAAGGGDGGSGGRHRSRP